MVQQVDAPSRTQKPPPLLRDGVAWRLRRMYPPAATPKDAMPCFHAVFCRFIVGVSMHTLLSTIRTLNDSPHSTSAQIVAQIVGQRLVALHLALMLWAQPALMLLFVVPGYRLRYRQSRRIRWPWLVKNRFKVVSTAKVLLENIRSAVAKVAKKRTYRTARCRGWRTT